jgi:very-short-patch-repair endonuclease
MSAKLYKKKEYLLRQFARTNKKNYENYVVTRIFHLINDLEIKFVTQQYFKRDNGKFGMADMYFPQFNLSIEIDESQHDSERHIDQDKIRDRDYVSATGDLFSHPQGWMPKRIRVGGDISLLGIDYEIEQTVNYIKELKKKDAGFIPWNIDNEFSYKGLKIFDVHNQIVFKKIVDAINYFRTEELKYDGYQKAGAMTMDKKKKLWFPKLFKNKDWSNTISSDETFIEEKPVQNSKWFANTNHLEKILKKNDKIRIVFAKVKGNLGFVLYRFKGYFVLNEELSKKKGYCCWQRKTTKVSIPEGNPIY